MSKKSAKKTTKKKSSTKKKGKPSTAKKSASPKKQSKRPIKKKSPAMQPSASPTKKPTHSLLKWAAIGAFANAILALPLFGLGFLEGYAGRTTLTMGMYLIVVVLASASIIAAYAGFSFIGRKESLRFLYGMAITLIVLEALGLLFNLATYFLSITGSLASLIYAPLISLSGILLILWGVSQLPLTKKFGTIAKAAATLNIITGACFAVIIFTPIGLVLLIPLMIVQGVLLWRAAKHYH